MRKDKWYVAFSVPNGKGEYDMKVRVFREAGGTFTVLCQPRPTIGLVPVAIHGVKLEGIQEAVLPVATKAENRRAALNAEKAMPAQA